MAITAVRRWQWMIVGIVLGLVLRALHDWDDSNLGRFGDAMNDPLRFERALVDEVANRPAFKDVRVHRQVLRDGAGDSKVVHIVTGKYCNGQLDPRDGGYHWRPTVFIAPIPYRHASYLPDVMSVDAVARYEAIADPTVLTFLEAFAADRGVAYTHAWWEGHPTVTWFGGSVLLIGVIWPTVINLLVFGSLVRPREERRADLRKLKAAAPVPAAASELTPDDLERLARLDAELTARLDGQSDDRSLVPANAMPRSIVKLEADPLATATATDADGKEFAAKPDDFYPTERRSSAPTDGRAAVDEKPPTKPRQ